MKDTSSNILLRFAHRLTFKPIAASLITNHSVITFRAQAVNGSVVPFNVLYVSPQLQGLEDMPFDIFL